ncbi:MAG: isopeptide-forming domain-containing fimbrial protein [Lachnospiraceae bacterium]|jgi:fimbrial isopeptide formation D2 family protein|nr:isopeptide-forming domain-containing fimbrial protein [Lachnospiraceae bacterium]
MRTKKKQISVLFMALLLVMSAIWSGLTSFKVQDASAAAASADPSVWQTHVDAFKWKTDLDASVVIPWDGTREAPTETVTLQNNAGQDVTAYKIYNAKQLDYALAQQWNVQLQQDIDLNGQAQNWATKVIGAAGVVIDGNGHTVYNMHNVGGYGFLQSGTDIRVENLSLKNARVDNAAAYAGIMIGQFATGRIERCSVEDSIISAAGSVIGGFACGRDSEGVLAHNKFVDHCFTRNVNMTSAACSSMFAECFWNGDITNCYAVDGSIIVSGGHSGGFTSCSRNCYYENCYTNIEVYGNTQTGVFCGIAHQGTHTFKNCYAAGKIEGTNTIGGFIAATDTGAVIIENCYSTSMVGMMSGGSNMGGFAGLGNNITFTNCYAAGEVGTLKSAADGTPLDDAGNRLTANQVSGFCGNNAGSYHNCYYDKQTTAMCDWGEREGVKGLLTKELIAQNLGDQWTMSSGGYPELIVFAESGNMVDRACSEASVGTVHLYVSEDGSEYDTVRRIRYVFPLTSNANSGKADFYIDWENYEGGGRYPNKSPLLEGDVPIIQLADQGSADNVSAVAPGVGWLQINAATGDATGTRRLRLVPTTAIAMSSSGNAVVGADAVIYTVPQNPENGYRPLPDADTQYDHREGISFVTTDAFKLNGFIMDNSGISLEEKLEKYQIKAQPFPENATEEIVEDGVVLQYELGSAYSDDVIDIRLERQKEDGSYTSALWTPSLVKLVLKQRTAVPGSEDLGVYRLTYEWIDGAAKTIKAQGSKLLSVLEPASVIYHWNDGTENLYHTDPGAYRVGESVQDNMPEDPSRTGYDFSGWVLKSPEEMQRGQTSFTKDTPLQSGKNHAYAMWTAHQHTVTVKDRDPQDPDQPPLGETDIAYGTPLLDELKKLPINSDGHEGEDGPIGWTTDPDSWIPDIDQTTTLPDHDLSVYPVWSASPAVKKTVQNETHASGENNVGDVLFYTIEASNQAKDSAWREVILCDRLPQGLTFIKGSAQLIRPDGSRMPLSDETVYDAEEHKIEYKLAAVYGEETYILAFEAAINEKAIDPAQTEEGGANRDISNRVQVISKNSDGKELPDMETEPVTPNPDEENQLPGQVTPYDPQPVIEKRVANETHPDGPLWTKDTLVYTIIVENQRDNSAWMSVVVKDELPQGIELVPGSIFLKTPNGEEISLLDTEAYDAQNHAIVYPIGNIYGKETYTLIFRAQVKEEMAALSPQQNPGIGNVASAEGANPHGGKERVETPDPVYPPGGGRGETIHKGSAAPTGDDAQITLYVGILSAAIILLCILLICWKKRHKQ